MTTRLLIGWAVVIALLLVCTYRNVEAVPPRAGQPHPDTFGAAVEANNLVMQKAKATRAVTYRLVVGSGCTLGTIASDLDDMTADVYLHWRLSITRVETPDADVVVQVNCGNVQISNCGSVNIFCVLGRPYYGSYDRPNASISDVLNTYPKLTRISILCHEICGHAILTWNEQYCVGYETSGPCAGQPLFTSTPGWVDVMNTGPDSRHLLGIIEDERADRTLGNVIQQCVSVEWDPCSNRWKFESGWSWSPTLDTWYDPKGRIYWEPRAPWGGRHSPILNEWLNAGTWYFGDDLGVWNLVP